MTLVLTSKEVREITGSAQRATQRKNLDALGVPYRVNARGWPVVLREAALRVLGDTKRPAPEQEEATINLECIR